MYMYTYGLGRGSHLEGDRRTKTACPQLESTTNGVRKYVCRPQGRRKGGVEGVRRPPPPPFLGANFIHFLYKVLGLRSVQKKDF